VKENSEETENLKNQLDLKDAIIKKLETKIG